MIPVAIPNLSGNEGLYLQQCIDSNYVSSVGPFVDHFEKVVADSTESAGAVATTSGTTALHLALTTVGVRPGDLVVMPSFTFIASANAVSHCGASPWLFDVNPASWTLDPDLLARELRDSCRIVGGELVHQQSGRRVSALMPVYALGLPADLDPIRSVADDYGLPIVADAAAAIGARYKGANLGGLATLSIASFNGNKTVTCGGGGALFGNDDELLQLARHLSTTARVGSGYDHDTVAFNYRLTNIQAAVGCAQFEQLPAFLQRKRELFLAYQELATLIPGAIGFPDPSWAVSAHWFSGLVLPTPAHVARAIARLRELGLDLRPFWKPVHLQKPYLASPQTRLVVSEDIWNRILVLPSSTSLDSGDVAGIVKLCARALRDG